MEDKVDEMYLSELHSKTRHEKQASFADFTDEKEDDETTIAVVSDPTGGIVEACDEFIPELGMPENELNNFRSIRSSLNIEDDVRRHNQAIDKTNLDEKYKDYVENDPETKEKLDELADRVKNGANITFVCFEKEPKWCHRHVLVDEIKSRIKTE